MILSPSLHSNVLVATPWPPARSLSYAFSSADDIVGVDRMCGGGAIMAVGVGVLTSFALSWRSPE